MNEYIKSKFRRTTSNNLFIPEVDGLRFIAILSVVLYHTWGSTIVKSNYSVVNENLFTRLIGNGFQGVEIFFAISGFILCLPFAHYYLNSAKKVSLRQYFLRRITRLEPPYFIAIIGMVLVLIVLGKTSLREEFPHTLASLLYSHNIIYQKANTILGGVTWSLEVEIQFYILAPIIFIIFKLPKIVRRTIYIFLILLSPVYNSILPIISVFSYLQFFIVGIFICDTFVSGTSWKIPKFVTRILTLVSLFALFYFENKGLEFFSSYYYPLILFVFFYLVLIEKSLNEFFSNSLITIIGGMCYTIYLLHFPIIGLFNDILLPFLIQYNIYLNYLISLFFYFVAILTVSSTFYLLIEKPCMQKHWPQALRNKILNIFKI